MDAAHNQNDGIDLGHRFETLVPLSVSCWWWYDTVAILADYSDWAQVELPPGSRLTVVEVLPAESESVMCELDDAEPIQRRVLPAWHFSWWGRLKNLGSKIVDFKIQIGCAALKRNCRRL